MVIITTQRAGLGRDEAGNEELRKWRVACSLALCAGGRRSGSVVFVRCWGREGRKGSLGWIHYRAVLLVVIEVPGRGRRRWGSMG